jgi:protein phosphatase
MTLVAKSGSAHRLAAAYVTDRGPLRPSNHDAVFFTPQRGLFMISDGVGGRDAAGLASKIVVRVLPKLLAPIERSPDPLVDAPVVLAQAIQRLSLRLRQEAGANFGLSGMGATVVALLIRRDHAVIGNLGDSRAYLFRLGKLMLLTRDHTVERALLDGKGSPAGRAHRHPHRARLSQYVGMEGTPEPDVQSISLLEGDRLLLASDGLHHVVTDAGIGQILSDHDLAGEATMALGGAVRTAGGTDDVSVLVVDWKGHR